MRVRILGIRGVPAAHGGFETFAEKLALYLVDIGWEPIVYCQVEGIGNSWSDEWRGIKRVHIPVTGQGPKGTIEFDWKSTLDASKHDDSCLVLGYNTAVFTALLRVRGVPFSINMDGIEWARAKWGPVAKLWFWLNDWAGCWLGNQLIADHPEIKNHLTTRVSSDKVVMIPYGGEKIVAADSRHLLPWNLEPGKFLTVIARAEPENSLLEIVSGFSQRPRGLKLVVLGNYDRTHSFQRKVLDAASNEVIFIGAIYDQSIVSALRFHCLAYVHGHRVGGTNPSLVEALGASNAVIAHDNKFNRWVAGPAARYFASASEFSALLDSLINDPSSIASMRKQSEERFEETFTWQQVLSRYADILSATDKKGKFRS